MDDILNELYDQLYTPPPQTEAEQEIDGCHRKLIERLEKPERQLVLRIINCQDKITDMQSRDSFWCGFRLAWQIMGALSYSCRDRRRKTNEAEADTYLHSDDQ